MKLINGLLCMVIGAFSAVTIACFIPDPNFIISSSEDKFIETHDTPITIYEEEPAGPGRSATTRAPKPVVFEKTITYKARILPVTVDGLLVQANDVVINGYRAYIAYNYAGDLFKGAIQIVDISNPGVPEIITELKFSSMDINTVQLVSNQLYFGGQADPDLYGFRSFIGVIDTTKLTNLDLNSIVQSIIGLKSYATTAITDQGNEIYVGVGAKNGYIQVLNNETLEVTKDMIMPDVRDVQKYQNGIVAIAGTTDNSQTKGRILIYHANNLDNPVVMEIPDFASPYHKSTIEMYNAKYAFLGLAEAGLKVLDITDNEENSQIVFELQNPAVSYTTKTNTNSVTTDSAYIFSANGEYGFRVLRVLNMSGKDSTFAEIVGYYPFEGLKAADGKPYSANHIDFKANHLFVASGAGGVNIYYLQ